jgi:hypothetical protein
VVSWWQELNLDNSDRSLVRCAHGGTPHPTLAVPSAPLTGNPTMVPPSSSRPMVVHQEALVLGESVQQALEEGSMQEVPTM